MPDTALYVYAIVPHSGTTAEFGRIGIDRSEVAAVALPEAGIAAIVHAGPPTPYQGPDAEVQRRVLEHSRVVEHAWETFGTVLPVTFNVIVKSELDAPADKRLRSWLQESAATMRGRLDALRGRVELRVEISLESEVAGRDTPESREILNQIAEKPAGLRRLLERKLEQLHKDHAAQVADRLYPDIRRRIAAITQDLVENRRHHAQPGHVSVFSAAVLTTRDSIEPLGAELARIQTEIPAAHIRFLGPWPPYSFTDTPPAP